MKLINCHQPESKLLPIDTPLNVHGQLFQTYWEASTGRYFEHNQTTKTWKQIEFQRKTFTELFTAALKHRAYERHG